MSQLANFIRVLDNWFNGESLELNLSGLSYIAAENYNHQIWELIQLTNRIIGGEVWHPYVDLQAMLSFMSGLRLCLFIWHDQELPFSYMVEDFVRSFNQLVSQTGQLDELTQELSDCAIQHVFDLPNS